jgi:ribosome-associated heat shock protein Hsp15
MTNANSTEPASAPLQRIDKWLWYARFFKSRSMATRLCKGRKLRINRRIVDKASASVKAGDVLTFPQGNRIRTIKVLEPGERRGPATEARTLYLDLAPPEAPAKALPRANGGLRQRGAGRPTKSDRRATDKLRSGD